MFAVVIKIIDRSALKMFFLERFTLRKFATFQTQFVSIIRLKI